MKAKITKGYSRKLSAGKPVFQSEEFFTNLEKEIEYNTKEEFLAENDKLAAQVKMLTQRDIDKYSEVIKLASANNPITTTESVA